MILTKLNTKFFQEKKKIKEIEYLRKTTQQHFENSSKGLDALTFVCSFDPDEDRAKFQSILKNQPTYSDDEEDDEEEEEEEDEDAPSTSAAATVTELAAAPRTPVSTAVAEEEEEEEEEENEEEEEEATAAEKQQDEEYVPLPVNAVSTTTTVTDPIYRPSSTTTTQTTATVAPLQISALENNNSIQEEYFANEAAIAVQQLLKTNDILNELFIYVVSLNDLKEMSSKLRIAPRTTDNNNYYCMTNNYCYCDKAIDKSKIVVFHHFVYDKKFQNYSSPFFPFNDEEFVSLEISMNQLNITEIAFIGLRDIRNINELTILASTTNIEILSSIYKFSNYVSFPKLRSIDSIPIKEPHFLFNTEIILYSSENLYEGNFQSEGYVKRQFILKCNSINGFYFCGLLRPRERERMPLRDCNKTINDPVDLLGYNYEAITKCTYQSNDINMFKDPLIITVKFADIVNGNIVNPRIVSIQKYTPDLKHTIVFNNIK